MGVLSKLAVKAATTAARKADPALEAAIRAGGKIYRGPTHGDALAAISDPALRREAGLDAANRGFVNERGRFLDRYKAADYARAFGLLSDSAPDWAKTAPELISENLRVKKARGGFAVKRGKK